MSRLSRYCCWNTGSAWFRRASRAAVRSSMLGTRTVSGAGADGGDFFFVATFVEGVFDGAITPLPGEDPTARPSSRSGVGGTTKKKERRTAPTTTEKQHTRSEMKVVNR